MNNIGIGVKRLCENLRRNQPSQDLHNLRFSGPILFFTQIRWVCYRDPAGPTEAFGCADIPAMKVEKFLTRGYRRSAALQQSAKTKSSLSEILVPSSQKLDISLNISILPCQARMWHTWHILGMIAVYTNALNCSYSLYTDKKETTTSTQLEQAR